MGLSKRGPILRLGQQEADQFVLKMFPNPTGQLQRKRLRQFEPGVAAEGHEVVAARFGPRLRRQEGLDRDYPSDRKSFQLGSEIRREMAEVG